MVPYTEPDEWMVGRKIEMRWWVGDSKKDEYPHCFEGTVMAIIPYSPARTNYGDFRLCKHAVALVQWDEEFNMVDGHVPLDPKKYMQENKHCGWNVLKVDYVEYAREFARLLKQADVDADVTVDDHGTGASPGM